MSGKDNKDLALSYGCLEGNKIHLMPEDNTSFAVGLSIIYQQLNRPQ